MSNSTPTPLTTSLPKTSLPDNSIHYLHIMHAHPLLFRQLTVFSHPFSAPSQGWHSCSKHNKTGLFKAIDNFYYCTDHLERPCLGCIRIQFVTVIARISSSGTVVLGSSSDSASFAKEMGLAVNFSVAIVILKKTKFIGQFLVGFSLFGRTFTMDCRFDDCKQWWLLSRLSLSVSVCLSLCPYLSVCPFLSVCPPPSLLLIRLQARTHARAYIHTDSLPPTLSFSLYGTSALRFMTLRAAERRAQGVNGAFQAAHCNALRPLTTVVWERSERRGWGLCSLGCVGYEW